MAFGVVASGVLDSCDPGENRDFPLWLKSKIEYFKPI
jgi:hypothetical protein